MWEVEIENQPTLRVGRLALTAPVPQSLALLKAGNVELPAEVASGLAALRYHPCLALLVTLSGASLVPTEGVALSDGPVRWIADNVKKGISPAGAAAAAVTVHLSPAFAAEHYAKTELELCPMIEQVIADVDVLVAVFAQGEAEALAGAAKTGRDQVWVLLTQQPGLVFLHEIETHHGVQTDPQLLLLLGRAQAQGFLELAELNHLLAGELVEEIGDRELHRQLQLGLGGDRR
jgi:hypothetical protein